MQALKKSLKTKTLKQKILLVDQYFSILVKKDRLFWGPLLPLGDPTGESIEMIGVFASPFEDIHCICLCLKSDDDDKAKINENDQYLPGITAVLCLDYSQKNSFELQ